MANENKDNKEKKPNIFVRAGRRIAKWFREMRSELKKVVWPTRKQVVNNTLVALFVMAIAAVGIWAFDSLADLGVEALIGLSGSLGV